MNQTPELTIDPVLAADFRTPMRRIASSVTQVTGRDLTGNPHGMGASAVMPVSMDPPTMLVSANQGAGLHSVLQSTGKFCVNLLGESHLDLLLPLSQSSRRTERFASRDWREGSDSLLYLSSAPAALFCELDHQVGYGTHTLFIGRVIAVRLYDHEVDPLVWFNGARAGVSREVALARIFTSLSDFTSGRSLRYEVIGDALKLALSS